MHCICCEVLRIEIEKILSELGISPQIHFIEQGLHDTPDELRKTLQQKVDELERQNVPEIILGYGLCGKGLYGLTSRHATLIIPSIHDCIPLLLGCDQQEAGMLSQNGSTFWLSPGWLRYSQLNFIRSREKRQKEYEELYGLDNALYLMEQEALWLQHYTNACFIEWSGISEREKLLQEAKFVAQDAKLPFRIVDGKDSFLKALLSGGNDERFLRVPPHKTIDINGDGKIVIVEV